MKPKMTISKKITDCYAYVELAEKSAACDAYADSNLYWKRATDIAIYLLDTYESGTFLDEEYDFLKQISKHVKE